MVINQKRVGAICSYVSIGLSAVVNLVLVNLLTRYMGGSEYGLYNMLGSLLSTFVILDFGLPATVIRYYSKYKALDDKKGMENILALCSRIYIILTAVLLAVGFVMYFYLGNIFPNFTAGELQSSKIVYIILLINILISLPSQIFNAIITAYERFVFLKLSSIVQVVLQTIVVILLIRVSPYAVTLAMVYTIFNFLLIVARVYYCFVKLKVKIKMHYFDIDLLKSILSYSFFIFLNVIIDQIFWSSNPIIIGRVINPAAVAPYSRAKQIAYNYMTLSTAISGLFLPKVTEMVTNNEPRKKLSDLLTKTGRIQFLLLSCILSGFILFGRQFINIWVGSEYGEVYLITLLLIIPFTVDLIQTIGLIILQALNMFRFKVYVFLGIAVLNIILAVPLAQKYAGIGCAMATGFTFFIGNAFIMNYYYSKYIGLDIKGFWIQMFKILVPTVVCAAFGSLLNLFSLESQVIDLCVKIVIYVLIYLAVIWLFVMNEYEKGLFIGAVNKIKKRFIKA